MHLVFPGIYTNNVQERRAMMNAIRGINAKLGLANGCDLKVYGRNQQFKLPNQGKANSARIQAIVDGSDPVKHVLTYFPDGTDDAKKLNLPVFEYNIPARDIGPAVKASGTPVVDVGGVNEWPLPVDIPMTWTIKDSPPEETLDFVKHVATGEHRLNAETIFVIMSWARGRRISFDHFLKWVSQGREITPARAERYADEWKRLDPAKSARDNRILMILGLMYPHCNVENQTLRRFMRYYDVPIDLRLDSLDDLHISNKRKRDELEGNCKFIYLACPMGSGKTQTMLERMQHAEEGDKIMFNASRQSLALDVHAKCKGRGLLITNYLEHNVHSKKSWGEYLDAPHQIISQDSLYKLANNGNVPEYKVLIIDEWEVYLNNWSSETHGHNNKLEKNWNVFIKLIRAADAVYVLDAFPSQKGVGFIKDLGYNLKVISTPHTATPRTVRIMQDAGKKDVYDNIMLRLGYLRYLNRAALAFYPYVEPHKDRKTINEIARGAYACAKANTSAEFGRTFENDCLVMEKRMDDELNAQVMADVNASWSTKGLVISNHKVTVGVSHTDKWFDRVVLCPNRATNLRDLIQFTMRARNLVSNAIEVYPLGGHKSHRLATDLAANSRLYSRDRVYRRLIDHIEYEKKATDDDCFRHLCDKAGYVMEEPSNDKSLGFARASVFRPAPFTSMMDVAGDTDASVRWINISIRSMPRCEERLTMYDEEDIDIPMDEFDDDDDYYAFLSLRKRIRQRRASTMDKLLWDKLHFKQLFRPGTDIELISNAWDTGKAGFVRNLHSYLKATCERSPRWRHPDLCAKIETFMVEVCNGAEDAVFPTVSDQEAHAIFSENRELTPLSPDAPSGNEMRLNAVSKYFFGQSIVSSNRKNNRIPWVPNDKFINEVMLYVKSIEAPETMQEVVRYVFPYMERPQAGTLEFPFMGH